MARWSAPCLALLLALAAPGCCMTALIGSDNPDYSPPYFFCCAATVEQAKWDPPILFMLPFDLLGDLLFVAPVTVAWIAGAYSRDGPEPEVPPAKPPPPAPPEPAHPPPVHGTAVAGVLPEFAEPCRDYVVDGVRSILIEILESGKATHQELYSTLAMYALKRPADALGITIHAVRSGRLDCAPCLADVGVLLRNEALREGDDLASDPSWRVRWLAALVLAPSRDPRAVEIVERLRSDPAAAVRVAAGRAAAAR